MQRTTYHDPSADTSRTSDHEREYGFCCAESAQGSGSRAGGVRGGAHSAGRILYRSLEQNPG
jgi:hypothetical protein